VFRAATDADMEVCRRLVLAEKMNPLGLDCRRMVVAAGRDGGEPLGMAQLAPLPGGAGEIRSLVVEPRHRRARGAAIDRSAAAFLACRLGCA
jgi:hypothetical protein